LPYDPSAARRLLRDAGFDPAEGRALHVTLMVPTGSEPVRRIAELLAAAAKLAGVELELRELEFAAVIAEQKKKDWNAFISYQRFESVLDPYAFLHHDGICNLGGWHDERADQLALAARAEFDPERRSALWRELHVLAHEQQPYTLIVHPLVTILLNKAIQNAVPGPEGLVTERAWVAVGDQRR
jgi:peptide/nickel transport system substrate-binding protein